jgi:hypothetical protein
MLSAHAFAHAPNSQLNTSARGQQGIEDLFAMDRK